MTTQPERTSAMTPSLIPTLDRAAAFNHRAADELDALSTDTDEFRIKVEETLTRLREQACYIGHINEARFRNACDRIDDSFYDIIGQLDRAADEQRNDPYEPVRLRDAG